jgi:hypothetical protein
MEGIQILPLEGKAWDWQKNALRRSVLNHEISSYQADSCTLCDNEEGEGPRV